jgi:hypothetical protein
METENILMGQKQLQRWHLRKMVGEGKITWREARERIGVSYRQAKRIRRAPRVKEVKGIIYGKTGQISNEKINRRPSLQSEHGFLGYKRKSLKK